jgi:protein phosphatase PTC1
MQLWDVCSDQEAVDLIRDVQDSQVASKILVDHALARFSTDNLSCMVIRLDAERHRDIVTRTDDTPLTDGKQSSTPARGISEADKIVEGARKSMANTELTDGPKKIPEETEKSSEEDPAPDPSVSPNGPAITLNQPSKPTSNPRNES